MGVGNPVIEVVEDFLTPVADGGKDRFEGFSHLCGWTLPPDFITTLRIGPVVHIPDAIEGLLGIVGRSQQGMIDGQPETASGNLRRKCHGGV